MTAPPARFDLVGKEYGGRPVVQDVSFTVEPGRVVGLLGRNGAGKSTLIRVLLGLAAPTTGRAEVFGRPWAELPEAARRIGVATESMGTVPGTTGRQEMRIWARTLGIGRDRVDELLDFVDLTGDADRPVRRYSTGMKRRLALGIALLSDPELLVLDEPANGLDPEGVRWLRRTLRTMADQGRSVLVCSHLLAEVEQSVDDVVVLERSVRYSGPLTDFVPTGSTLEDAFFDAVGERSLPTGAEGVSHV